MHCWATAARDRAARKLSAAAKDNPALLDGVLIAVREVTD